ncbi:MAG TPA: hypothetical protein VM818_00960 [Vicinamibacterales bacterium]|jgi:hypothetical protein|nr:hypothetical protein [Vicinamibacterales bacterium]
MAGGSNAAHLAGESLSVLALNRRHFGEPPAVTFEIASAVLALTVRLIDRL